MSGAVANNNWCGPADSPDRYRLDELQSRGGEGELWSGSISVDGQLLPVAIKVLHPAADQDFAALAERLRQEAEVLRSLDHPSLVKVREMFEGPPVHPHGAAEPSQRALFLVMNWALGENLTSWLAANPQRDTLACTRIVSRLAAAVDYLHSGRATGGTPVLHRDIKPANVIVESNSGEVRLVDFGFVRFAGPDLATLAGTPAYIAPEIVAGAPATEASDRFGVGATAYYLFTGESPNTADPGAMHAALQGVTGIEDHEGFANHVMAMMDRDPARRPSNLVEWAQNLAVGAVSQRFPPAGTSLGGPQAANESVAKPKKRRKWLLAVAILVVVALGVGAFFAFGRQSTTTASAGSSSATSRPATLPAVPSVTGQSLSLARSTLEADGFTVRVSYQESTKTKDTVLSQSPTAGETASDQTVMLTVAKPPSTTPNLVGQDLSSATATLEALGIAVKSQDQLDEKTPDGKVLAQDPAAGTPLATTVTLTVSRQPVITYLSTVSTVEGEASTGPASISGTTYTRSVSLGLGGSSGSQRSAGYDLSRAYRRFRATVGLTDSADAHVQVKIEVLGDGRSLFSQTVGLGQAVPVDVDVTGVLRLTLSATVVTSSSSCCAGSVAAFGDAAILATQGSVPSTTTTTR